MMKHPAILLTAAATICSQFVRWGLVNWIVKILITPRAVVDGGLSESADGIFAGGRNTAASRIALMAATVAASAMHWGGAFFSITKDTFPIRFSMANAGRPFSSDFS